MYYYLINSQLFRIVYKLIGVFSKDAFLTSLIINEHSLIFYSINQCKDIENIEINATVVKHSIMMLTCRFVEENENHLRNR